jgi:AcrR family transcriptional regulator
MNAGYDAVSVEAIAEAVGVTKASIYYYFSSKADLFVACLESLLHVIHHETARILSSPQPFRDRLLELTEVRLRVSETRFDFEHVVREAEALISKEQCDQLRTTMDSLAELLTAAFKQAMNDGELRPTNPQFAAHAYFALLNVAFARSRDDVRLFTDPKQTAQELVDLILCGLEENPG